MLKGSQRCILDLVDSPVFLSNINNLIQTTGAIIHYADNWIPKGYSNPKEAELKDFLKYNFTPQLGQGILNWWLAVPSNMARTPNWDLISTCTINGTKGILLVEAKAHWKELESNGKVLPFINSANSEKNHKSITNAIQNANSYLKPNYNTSISIDCCYQLSNRISHAWWLANNGIPVVLLYLGFLNVSDMGNGKNILFKNHAEWEKCFNEHCKFTGVDNIVNKWVNCGLSEFIMICKSL